jgi:hypothetical protein
MKKDTRQKPRVLFALPERGFLGALVV